MDNNVKIGQVLEFCVAFPTETPLTPEEYLKGGSKGVILKIATWLLSHKQTEKNDVFFSKFFSSENAEFAKSVYGRIKELENDGKTIIIINQFTSLSLFEIYFSRKEQPETQTHAEFERNLFKTILVINTQFAKKQMLAFETTKELDDEIKLPMMCFCTDYPMSDKTHYNIYNIWVTQLVKAIFLFQFLESNSQAQKLLTEFLKHFNKLDWQEYLNGLLSLTIFIIDKKETYTDISVPQKDCEFVEKFIVQYHDELNENDFLTLRAKPLYKIEEGKYRVIFDLFVVEKIFKGQYFLLNEINKLLPTIQQIKEFRSFYGKEFSEKILAYKVIENIYSGKCIKFSGQELDDKKNDGVPDYYIRKGKNILLFESKDFLIRADKKQSFDYNVYEEEFTKLLYYTKEKGKEKEKPKAVLQLINNIEKLLKSEFTADKDYKYKEINIYPILLIHDCQYDTLGFNRLLNYWFLYELQQLAEDKIFTHKVRPLTIVNIDTLIYYQMGLIEEITLTELIDKYHLEMKAKPKKPFNPSEDKHNYALSKQIHFSLYAENYFNSINYRKMPPILDIIQPALFGKEANAQ
jgi:hypothetical protein